MPLLDASDRMVAHARDAAPHGSHLEHPGRCSMITCLPSSHDSHAQIPNGVWLPHAAERQSEFYEWLLEPFLSNAAIPDHRWSLSFRVSSFRFLRAVKEVKRRGRMLVFQGS
jgi:hypothetical protein